MSKYNLSDILNEYIGGGRIGTLRTTAKHIIDKMDELEEEGEVVVRELQGPSGDGKVNMEFEVVDREFAVPGGNKQERGFTVYDYKFGFVPRDPVHVDVEYDYSIGGNDIRLAMDLFRGDTRFEIVKGRFMEDLFSKDGGSEDNVDNIDQVASPSAKGKGYSSAVDAERSESGKEQSKVTLAVKRYPQQSDTTTSLSPFTIDANTDKKDTRARGRFVNIKIENTDVSESWRFGTLRIDIQPDGKR